MNDIQKQIKLAELIQKELDGVLTDQEFVLLQSILKEDNEAVDYYVRTILSISAFSTTLMVPSLEHQEEHIQEDLSDSATWRALAESERTAPCIEDHKETPKMELLRDVRQARAPRRINKVSLYSTFISLAAMLCMIIYVSLNPRIPMQAVARLTDSVDAKWGNPGHTIKQGSVVYNTDDYRFLVSGIVKLEYNFGTEVLIEGPAYFKIPSEDELDLQSGRLFARVPESATGFTVSSPTSSVIDLGTEFGIRVNVDGTSDVCLFKGKASLIAGRKGQTEKSEMLVVGDAKRVDRFAQVQDIGDVSTLFAREISSKTRTVWRGEPLSLASLVAGGDGFTEGGIVTGIDPATGHINSQVIQEFGRYAEQGYHLVPNRRFIDGVFVPNGSAGANIVTSAGHTFKDFPVTDSYYWSDITANPTVIQMDSIRQARKSVRIFLNTREEAEKPQSLIFLHPNAGITFDLEQVRASLPQMEITGFNATCGLPADTVDNESEFWILVDGQCVFHHKQSKGISESKKIEIPLNPENQFLTLAATDGADSIVLDWCVFANPQIQLQVSPVRKDE